MAHQDKRNDKLIMAFRDLVVQMRCRTELLTAQFRASPSELDAAASIMVVRFQETINILERVVSPGVVETITEAQFQGLRPLLPSFVRRIKDALALCDQFINHEISIVEFSEQFQPLAARCA